jgi:hypothetical protein
MSSMVHGTASPLHRFVGNTTKNDKPIYWGRAGSDGIPMLGAPRQAYGEEEFARKMVPTRYFMFREFDLSKEVDQQAYLDTMDKIVNGLFQLTHKERRGNVQDEAIKWYLEWYEVYLQDGSMADAIMESTRQ